MPEPLGDWLKDTDSMLVYADLLEERGDETCTKWRDAAFVRNELEKLLKREVYPAGSRYYGSYWTEASDWDFVGRFSLSFGSRSLLEDHGWKRHTNYRNGAISYYCREVNFIPAYSNRDLAKLLRACEECRQITPSNKQQTIKIWDDWQI